MKYSALFDDMSGEFIPKDRTKSSASSIGSQLARTAMAKTGGNRNKARKLADTLAQRFLTDVTKTIDDELGMGQAQSVDNWA